jgi:hypothetical protein
MGRNTNKSKNLSGAGVETPLVITPGGPRRSDLVHEVKPGQTVYPDQQEGYIVANERAASVGP